MEFQFRTVESSTTLANQILLIFIMIFFPTYIYIYIHEFFLSQPCINSRASINMIFNFLKTINMIFKFDLSLVDC